MNYKLSKYIVISPSVGVDQYRLIYSTISTVLMVCEKEDFDALTNEMFHKLDANVFERFKKVGIIVDKDFDELQAIIEANKAAIAKDDVLSQIVSPSANCQLGCDYCGQVHTKDALDDDLSAKVLKRVTHNIGLKEYKGLSIGWFGAEPLMGLKNIKALSEAFIALAQTKNIIYSARMVTNGLSLKKDIFYDLLENYKVNSFEITLDGTEEHHDIRRYTKLKEKTFALIFKNLKAIVSDERFNRLKPTISIRCNVDASNYKSTFSLIDLLHKENILQNVSFYTAPIHSWGNDAHLKSLSLDAYAKFQIEVFMALLEKDHEFTLVPGKKTHVVCTSLKENAEVFDAYGDVYNCTEISQVPAYKDDDSYKVAKLKDSSYSNSVRPYEEWNDEVLNGDFPCANCRILPICGGACPKLWKEDISPCPPIKYNIEERMLLEFYKKKIHKKENVA